MLTATTRKAVVAHGGKTVHAAFRLTVNRDGAQRDNELNTFRNAFRNVRCVIIDEVSMMSAYILQRVDSRLRTITCKYL